MNTSSTPATICTQCGNNIAEGATRCNLGKRSLCMPCYGAEADRQAIVDQRVYDVEVSEAFYWWCARWLNANNKNDWTLYGAGSKLPNRDPYTSTLGLELPPCFAPEALGPAGPKWLRFRIYGDPEARWTILAWNPFKGPTLPEHTVSGEGREALSRELAL